MILTLKELAERIGGNVLGDPDCTIKGVATLQNACAGDITFLSNPVYRKYLSQTSASAVILSKEDESLCSTNALIVDEPYVAYARTAKILNPVAEVEPGIHPSANIASDVTIDETVLVGPNVAIESGVIIGSNVVIGPGCVIGKNSAIGENSRLGANVTLCHEVRVGRRAIIHPGVVLGGDGFGLANDNGTWIKVPQLGRLVIGDDVEIGANTTVDRGALDDTVLEDGVKLDNQIQVAHNVCIGAHTAIAACVGIAGSTTIGKRCTIGGGVGIIGHLKITDDVHITAMSFVTNSISEPGLYSSGMPVEPNRVWRKNIARLRNLDETIRRGKEKSKES